MLIPSFHKYLLSTYCVQSTLIGMGIQWQEIQFKVPAAAVQLPFWLEADQPQTRAKEMIWVHGDLEEKKMEWHMPQGALPHRMSICSGPNWAQQEPTWKYQQKQRHCPSHGESWALSLKQRNLGMWPPNQPSKIYTSGWTILNGTVFLFYYLFILIQSFGISNFMKK